MKFNPIVLLLVFFYAGCSSNVLEQVDEFEYVEGVVERLTGVQAVVDIHDFVNRQNQPRVK